MKHLMLQLAAVLLCACMLTACHRSHEQAAENRPLVLKHPKMEGDPEAFRTLLAEFQRQNPGIEVREEILPPSTDEQHQFYTINLEGKTGDFDVFAMDIIWVPEFARAGWIADLDSLYTADELHDFFPAAVEAATWNGHRYAIPWYLDAGVLFYRSDLLQKYGMEPPRTYPELVRIAQYVIAPEPDLYGFIWQGKQYETLVCNALEFFWGNGGGINAGAESVARPQNVEALSFMRDLLEKYRVTPQLVLTSTEEEIRQLFGNGRAVFMRNWPYAWHVLQRKGSPVRGKVGVAPLPGFPGHEGHAALGGWQLAVNRFSRRGEDARKLIRFLTSAQAQKLVAARVGYMPSRMSLYADPELLAKSPFLPVLRQALLEARPRPVTPYYMMMSQILQPELSAAVAGIRPPQRALESAQMQMSHMMREER